MFTSYSYTALVSSFICMFHFFREFQAVCEIIQDGLAFFQLYGTHTHIHQRVKDDEIK